MQFNSYEYVLLFLPVTVLLYFLLNRIHVRAGKLLLIAASLVFYAWTGPKELIVLGISVVVNYVFALLIQKGGKWRRVYLIIPVAVNVCLLFWFKYLDFAVSNVNRLLHTEYAFRTLALPLGISFFTFQQIAYVVSVFRGEVEKADLIDYLVYILYFPKILMGPLTEPSEFLAQLNDDSLKKWNWENLVSGLKLFSFGLFKKLLLADTFAKAVSWGFGSISETTSMDWILIMLCYTFQIYFDFSGYSDMATGSSLMLNIMLPINFDSPYKALNIRDFWKRWHVSLTKFLTKYIYIPLGGSRKGKWFTCLNTLIVFLISGIWHGANWTFIVWGILHGLLMIFDRATEKRQESIFKPVRWLVSFSAVNVLWLLFSSYTVRQWGSILKLILRFESMSVSEELIRQFVIPESVFFANVIPFIDNLSTSVYGFWMLLFLTAAFVIVLIPENNYRSLRRTSPWSMAAAALAFLWGVICLGSETVFVYFRF